MCVASAATPDDERIGTPNPTPKTLKTTDPEEFGNLAIKNVGGVVSALETTTLLRFMDKILHDLNPKPWELWWDTTVRCMSKWG